VPLDELGNVQDVSIIGRESMKTWTKASADLRLFNGLVQSRRTTESRDIGIFKERHPLYSHRWSIRTRQDGGRWGLDSDFNTKHEAVEYADKWYKNTGEGVRA
jgi:hypothetical protein